MLVMTKKKIGVFDLFDELLARDFGVAVEVYIETIEKASKFRAETIIMGMIKENPKKREQACRCFKLLSEQIKSLPK